MVTRWSIFEENKKKKRFAVSWLLNFSWRNSLDCIFIQFLGRPRNLPFRWSLYLCIIFLPALRWLFCVGLLFEQRFGAPRGMTMDWQSAPPSPSSYIVKKILRLEIPVDTYPNVNTPSFAKHFRLHSIFVDTQVYMAAVQFCWTAPRSPGQFAEASGGLHRLPCVHQRKGLD